MPRESDPELSINPETTEPAPLTWGATPLQVYGRTDIQRQQQNVYDALLKRTSEDLPFEVPESLKAFIDGMFMARFHERSMKNYESHESRLKKDIDNIDIEFLGIYERAKEGLATPSELLAVRREFGMRSIELAKVTHPYGKEIKFLEPMRRAVVKGILENGGIIYDPRETQKFKLLQSDIITATSQAPSSVQYGFSMTRKRLIGEIDDDTRIYERSSFIVRIDEASGFDQALAREMHNVPVINNPLWAKEFFEAGRLDETIPYLLEHNEYQIAIPLSTTTYAYNMTTDHAISKAMEMEKDGRPRDISVERLREMARQSMDSTQIALFNTSERSWS